ncbi:MAG: ABC transporter ATP-binding protein [Deltaproteobacteria bacterium]|nr:ABC transporter ATP-binding protein [Deltaproteobacteria bacterium]
MTQSGGQPGAIVSLDSVYKNYKLGSVEVPALRGIDLAIDAGEFTVIAGPSGSGKTTLLNLVGCVDVASSGTVRVAGEDTGQLSERALTQLRLRALGFIFQSFNLVSVLDAFQNVEFPLLLQGGSTKGERARRVDELMDKVGLGKYKHHRPNELSGGQRQRVAIARALVTNPRIVLADEPTANLDSATGHAIIDLMKELNTTQGTTFIFSTHDPKVMHQAGRLVELVDGQIASIQQLGVDAAPPADPHAPATAQV